jgi:hypothetical protein
MEAGMIEARALAAGLLLAAAMLPVSAQTSAAASPLDDAVRAEVVAKAAEALRTRYVFPDAGEAAARRIESQLAVGAYSTLDTQSFAATMTADLQSVTKDRHMRVHAPAPATPQPAAAPPQAPPPANEGGFVRADRLPGNIGYVEVLSFPQLAAFQPAADRALASLKDTSALIIDLRRNGGGTPEAVAYLMSFFIDQSKPPQLINEFTYRVAGTKEFTTNQVFSMKTAGSYLGKPVYVLTSAQTFSGGEGFAYNMQAFKLAVVVGEITGGGGTLGGIGPIGWGYGLFVPNGRPINPETKTNWDGVGVIPEIMTAQEDALQAAMQKQGQRVSSKSVEALSVARLFGPRAIALPGTEALLRKLLGQIAEDKPDYDMLSAGLGNAVRQQMPVVQARLRDLGAIKAVAFVQPGTQGGDTYDVEFEKGALRWTLIPSPDGKKIEGAVFGPAPSR